MSAPFYSPTHMNPPGFDAEPVPISSYQDTEPVPISSYQDTEPVLLSTYQGNESDPRESTQQEKDDFWENGFNREEAVIEDPEPFQPKENGKRSVDDTSFTHGETDLNQLPAIPPVSTGQGPPYAPVDWPSPGDVWTWRVGRRVTATGYHQDRFLILPQRLQQKNVPKSFASKPTLTRYIQSNFPGMDADAFFASFSWKIPALFQPASKVDAASLFEETSKEVQTEFTPNDENAQNGKKEGNSRYSQRMRKPMPTQTYEPITEKPKATRGSSNKKKKGATTPATGAQSSTRPKSSRQSARRPANQQQGGAVDLNFLDEEGEPGTAPDTTKKRKKRKANYEDEDVSVPHIYVSPMNGVLAVSHSPIDVNPEEFDSYLNSLDNLLQQPPEEFGQESSVLVSVSSPMKEYEWAEARMKISSLLERDFSSLFLSKDAAGEIAALATKLRKDPNLSAEEIVRLKLIEEIPTFSEVFQDNKGVIEEADRFFSALELNKAKVASLKYEYSELKEKLGGIQMEVDTNSETIRQIDNEIAQLQARRSELKRYIGNKEKERVDLSYGQKMVANSIPKVVQEVQSANSKKPEWECKKDNALKREAEILSKFSPLKGFFL